MTYKITISTTDDTGTYHQVTGEFTASMAEGLEKAYNLDLMNEMFLTLKREILEEVNGVNDRVF